MLVTPCMGVWIETETEDNLGEPTQVTPCMGVWIETFIPIISPCIIMSHPVWVCGLKPFLHHRNDKGYRVTPCMGVWIETPQEPSMRV